VLLVERGKRKEGEGKGREESHMRWGGRPCRREGAVRQRVLLRRGCCGCGVQLVPEHSKYWAGIKQHRKIRWRLSGAAPWKLKGMVCGLFLP